MKKGLWGYSVQEVDETIEFLETQNGALTARINRMESEIAAAKEHMERLQEENLETQRIKNALEVVREELETARVTIADLTKEKESVILRAKDMEARLEAREESDTQDELELVGEICRKAYADMANVKQQAVERMNVFVGGLLVQWGASMESMGRFAAQIDEAKEKARESFIQSADEILTEFEEFQGAQRQLQEIVNKATGYKGQMSREMDKLMESLKSVGNLEDVQTAEKAELTFDKQTKPVKAVSLIGSILSERRKKVSITQEEALAEKKKEGMAPAAAAAEKLETEHGILNVFLDVKPKDVINK